jgi:MoaA/NifB/PqqE/SkfB family radical SAM enzyme
LKHLKAGLNFGKAILKEKLGIKTPIIVTFITTFRCPLQCKFCGVWKRRPYEMNLEEIKKMMDEFAEMGTIKMGLTGGEPLLRTDIKEIIDYSKSKGFVTSMVSNGTIIKGNIDKIKNLDLLLISIDGNCEIHNKIRGPGVYEKATEGALLARDAGIDVCIQTVLTGPTLENNCKGLRDVIDFVKVNGLKFICQPIYYDPYNLKNEDMKDLELIEANYKEAIRLIRAFKKEMPSKVMLSQSEINWFERWKSPKSKLTCHAGRLFFMIEPDGKLIRCILKDTEKVDGLKLGFKNAINQVISAPKDCKCALACYTKYNHLFNLNIDALKEVYNSV